MCDQQQQLVADKHNYVGTAAYVPNARRSAASDAFQRAAGNVQNGAADGVIAVLNELLAKLEKTTDHLRETADRVVGPQPPSQRRGGDETTDGPLPPTDGSLLGRLNAVSNRLSRDVSDLQEQVKRLATFA